MQQIVTFELNELQKLLYELADVPEFERQGKPYLGDKASTGILDRDQEAEFQRRVINYEALLHEFFIEEDEAHEQQKPFTGTLRWSDPRIGKQKTLTKQGTIKYLPVNAATLSSIIVPPTAPIHVSTPVRAPSAPLVDVGGYETESLPA
jgi:hypothetical protein